MSDNIKDKLKLIQKIAQELPTRKGPGIPGLAPRRGPGISGGLPPRKGPGKTVAPVAPTPSESAPAQPAVPTSTTFQKIPEVQAMQQSMQQLADEVMRDAQSETMPHKSVDTQPTPASESIKTAKKGFIDFIAEQYIGELDPDKRGVEWGTDKSVTKIPAKQKTETGIYELNVVMDTLHRIGTGSSEFSADGMWGNRTQNALKNIMGFGHALLQLEGDFGIENTIYNLTDWKGLFELLSGYTIDATSNSLSASEQSEKATLINKHLKAILKLYNDFTNQVLKRPDFIGLLEGKSSFEQYDATGTAKDILTPEEEGLSAKAEIPVTLMTPAKPGQQPGRIDRLPLSALKNKESFETFIRNYGWDTKTDIAPKLLRALKQQLATK